METSIKKKMFGSEAEFVLYDIDEFLATDIVDVCYKEGLRLQKIFNFYDQSSELSELNRKRKIKASPELSLVISAAIIFSKMTAGKYDVSLGKTFLKRKKGEKESIQACSYKDIAIDGNIITLKHPDVMVDLGSIAKGFIVDKMIELMMEEGVESGMIDGRGDIRVFGQPQVLGIQHPRDKDKVLKFIRLIDAAVATTGDYNQYIGSHEMSHIINARDIISVTVVADDLMTADAYATALFVSENPDMLLKDKKIKAMMVDKDMNIRMYNDFEELEEKK